MPAVRKTKDEPETTATVARDVADLTPTEYVCYVREILRVDLPSGRHFNLARCTVPALPHAGLITVVASARPGDKFRVTVSRDGC
jgi:hypothetical protein